ncbi:MAG: prohibitin family protein, partial [Saprospiraceae bacterium]
MFLIVLSIIFLAVYFVLSRKEQHPSLNKFSQYFKLASIGLAIVGILTSCFVQVNGGYVGVQSLFGKVQDEVLYPGLHFINPLLDVKQMDARTLNYTMSGVHDEGNKAGDDGIRALTKDGLEVVMDVTVLYQVIAARAPRLLNEIGVDYQDKVIRPIARTKIRDFCVYYDAVELYSQKRDEFQLKIFKSMETDFNSRGLILDQLLVRNITLPAMVKSAIEEKIKAEQDAQKMQFVLQKEKQEAERKRVEAQGIADYQKIINTGLTKEQLQYEMIKAYKELSTSANSKVIVLDGKSS